MATITKLLIGGWVAALLAYIFLVLPPAAFFAAPELARIVTLHLPNAYVAVVAAFMAGWFGWRYLARGRSAMDDAKSVSAAGLAALFCLLTTASGSVFAKYQWGSYWNWDPRQTSVFLLLLVYGAYFVLRAGIDDPDKKASVSAVYVLFATVMTPTLGYFIPKAMMSLHPTNTSFDAPYRIGIYGMALGLLGLMLWMHGLNVRAARARLALASIEEEA